MTRALCIALIIAGASNAQDAPPLDTPAQPSAQEPSLDAEAPLRLSGASILWENDGQFYRLTGDSDRYYTNGVEIDISFTRPIPAFTAKLLPFGGFYDDDANEAGGFVLAQQMFTPEDINEADLIEDDRPYAGYLYAGMYVQRSDRFNFDHLELDIGVVGEWAGAEAAQEAVHAALPNQLEPRGWGNQLSNELAINLTYEHRWRTPKARFHDIELDAIAGLGGRLGNVHIDANANLTARIGYNLPDDFGPATIDSFRDATGTWQGDFSIYGFARVRGQAVARNIFLDGNTFANSHSVDKNAMVASLQYGIILRYKWFETGWSETWRSEQFEGQDGWHAQGAWYVGARFVY